MIAPAHWRRGGPEGREAIPAPGEHVTIADRVSARHQASGSITSHGYNSLRRKDVEFVAYQLGVQYATAKRAIELGLV